MTTIGEWWMWVVFFCIIATALAIDFILLKSQKAHVITIREAATWTIAWISLALTFNFLLWVYLTYVVHHPQAAAKSIEFLTGYLLEESLSVDNIFVFLVIFQYFNIPREYQRRVLLYGVLGAIIMRFIITLFGIYLVAKFHWILYVFGLFLAITGIKLFFFAGEKQDISTNPILKLMQRFFRITHRLSGEKFFVKKNQYLYATPLFLTVVLIEVTDLIFAIDSIPAVFSVTHDPFIVFTSNIFAILGLRMLYFLFSYMAHQFYLLKYAVAFILFFVGMKMMVAFWIKIPVIIALLVILSILTFSILISIIRKNSH
ncbi:MAG: hypothetical protein A3F10_05410 [Coxiella sp. RIFCSPHIGHO2_12_FULL_42_15]|nr:MAG: hypothetical protein A3F10_05410 [Coxiella sp. RIFCSPHIGHO2_12_FULL_42_15]